MNNMAIHILMLYPEGTISSNTDMGVFLKNICDQGNKVDIYTRHRSYSQDGPCSGVRITETSLIDPLETAILFAPGIRISEENIDSAAKTFRHYGLVIGVDLGIIEACMVAKIIKVPYGLFSYAPVASTNVIHELKEPLTSACNDLHFALCKEWSHAVRISVEYEIPLVKIMNFQFKKFKNAINHIEPSTQKIKSIESAVAPSLQEPPYEETEHAVTLLNQGNYAAAETIAKRHTIHFPHHGLSWKILGAIYKLQGRTEEALTPMEKATLLLPTDAGTHNNLGVTLADLNRLEDAARCYLHALEVYPDYAEAHNNLGIAQRNMGRHEESIACYQRALEIKPDFAEAYCNFGVVLTDLKRMEKAEASYRHALKINPSYTDALNNLALLLNEQGKSKIAMETIKQSLRIKESSTAKNIFVCCIKNLRLPYEDHETRLLLVRALTEPWCRPIDLTGVATELLKLNPDVERCLSQSVDVWPDHVAWCDLFGPNGLARLAAEPLLHALLNSAPVCDIKMERFLTIARHALLENVIETSWSTQPDEATLVFYGSLASQCFINEYVFFYTDEEINKAERLRQTLDALLAENRPVPQLLILAVASYFPLYTLPRTSLLIDFQWPAAVASVLVQQIQEPKEELCDRAGIPQLTSIEDGVSLRVQNQYEENPYPRWIRVAQSGTAVSVTEYLRQRFPSIPFKSVEAKINEVLVAGCGTGQHPIGTAQRFRGANILAVDLSISSLSYAKRKTRELGITSIEYAQADLLKLGVLGRSFDVIESSGVLHHLADPWKGWQVLVSLLRPGGFMKLGFYSEIARSSIVRIRDFIANQGYESGTAHDIRQLRQVLINMNHHVDFGNTLQSQDFFSISTCRDLLFHVQEHRMTLDGISGFLRENNLEFLGFEIDPYILKEYKRSYPDDKTATNLVQWQKFENENPDTFFGMYQFWIQKTA